MEWTESLKSSIEYVEEHLLEDISIKDIADSVNISSFYFQKGFKVMTGITVAEYIRNRRLYLAALDIIADKMKIIDLAYKYGYDSPESFSKAFRRFHGIAPAQIKGDSRKIKTYLPLKITVSIVGGDTMDYTVEKMEAMKVIGFKRRFEYDSAYGNIPGFWDEFCQNCSGGKNTKEVQEVIEKNMIGEFGICIDNDEDATGFQYMIAGTYVGGDVPEEMEIYEIPAMEWAKFRCVGPLPGALQTVNTQVFQEWLPGNGTYEIACGMNIEWYSAGDMSSKDYESGIWIPVKQK